jgi:pyridinium-3,5-biscarboxylic acid mononucleotide synthase
MSESLQALLTAVASGKITPELAGSKIQSLGYEAIDDFAKIDRDRQQRTGFPEVIWGLGKTPTQIVEIVRVMRHQQSIVMATRITPAVYNELHREIPDLIYYQTAQICALTPLESTPIHPGKITILTAGTADLPVAEEAAQTAILCGFKVEKLWDVGVAGIQRLLNNRHVIDDADVLIVVAGMEGALPSVVAGLADCPVIAVPTSIGYGASFGGIAPLLTMLNSCAAGVGVVNIDNGFGAAILACQILRTAAKVAKTADF